MIRREACQTSEKAPYMPRPRTSSASHPNEEVYADLLLDETIALLRFGARGTFAGSWIAAFGPLRAIRMDADGKRGDGIRADF